MFQIFCFAWSPDGKQCATVCKDGLIRIYNPRRSNRPVKVGRILQSFEKGLKNSNQIVY